VVAVCDLGDGTRDLEAFSIRRPGRHGDVDDLTAPIRQVGQPDRHGDDERDDQEAQSVGHG
jgi:hypothetical protein